MRFTKRNTISRNKNLQIDQTYKQKSGFKPNGLWYSYYSSWYKWILENELYHRLYKYIHHIGIANKSLTNIYEQDYNKILVIKNTTDFDIFHNKYKIKNNANTRMMGKSHYTFFTTSQYIVFP